jgi:hypothetical protein
MKLLMVTEDTAYLAGGRIEFLKLCRALAMLNHSVTILTCSGATQDIIDAGPARMIRLPIWQTRFIGPAQFLVKLTAYFARLDTDMPEAVVVNAGYAVLPTVILAKLKNLKVVGLYHDALALTELIRYAVSPTRKLTAVIRWLLMYAPLGHLHGVISVSPWTAERLRRMGLKTPITSVGNVVEV